MSDETNEATSERETARARLDKRRERSRQPGGYFGNIGKAVREAQAERADALALLSVRAEEAEETTRELLSQAEARGEFIAELQADRSRLASELAKAQAEVVRLSSELRDTKATLAAAREEVRGLGLLNARLQEKK